MITLMAGAILAAALFAALLWSIYRAVVTQGMLRINASVLSLGTVLGMAGITWSIPTLVMIAAPACFLFGLAQMMTDPGWSKLLPLVQMALGAIFLNALISPPY